MFVVASTVPEIKDAILKDKCKRQKRFVEYEKEELKLFTDDKSEKSILN